jgi:hypothetical protein
MSGDHFLCLDACQAPREDGDDGDRNKRNEMLFRALEDDIQPPVAGQPGERTFNHPANAGGNELSVATAGDRLDGDAERLAGLSQPLPAVGEVAKSRALEAAVGERAQDRDDGFRIVPVRWGNIDRERDAILSTAT